MLNNMLVSIYYGMRMNHIRDFCKLSTREKECLDLWACGYTAKGIGIRLRISPRTVESYIEKIKIKIGLYSKTAILEEFYRYKGSGKIF